MLLFLYWHLDLGLSTVPLLPETLPLETLEVGSYLLANIMYFLLLFSPPNKTLPTSEPDLGVGMYICS